MADKMRWRYGDTRPVLGPVGSSTIVAIGDVVYLSGGNVLPASSLSDLGTKAANQEAIHDSFLGIAMQASPDGASDPIRVATAGVFELDCASSTFVLGDLVGVDENGDGDEVLPQTVIKVAACNLAIGRCAKTVSPAGTKVLIDVESTAMRGGPQVAA